MGGPFRWLYIKLALMGRKVFITEVCLCWGYIYSPVL